VQDLYYGCDEKYLYVRLDGAGDGSFGIEFEDAAVEAEVAAGRIVELRAPRAGQRFRVTVARDGLPGATVPSQGWIELS
jgi:hypothetical protein